jgi:chromosome partitioning protein
LGYFQQLIASTSFLFLFRPFAIVLRHQRDIRTYYSRIIASLNGKEMTENQIRVALMSNAGGSGKTTLAVNVGHELFSAGFSVCLFGLDPNASLKTFVGLGGENPEPDQSIKRFIDFE